MILDSSLWGSLILKLPPINHLIHTFKSTHALARHHFQALAVFQVKDPVGRKFFQRIVDEVFQFPTDLTGGFHTTEWMKSYFP